jgi:hypothetical protein
MMASGHGTSMPQSRPRLIAFYLPQFHPIPENDRAWGLGFTEWTNVKKARPLFEGHHQPRVPADPLGYYALPSASVQRLQGAFAQQHGIESFAYWYYWMGSGARLLERPLDAMLRDVENPHGFCLAWANESWTGVWHGKPRHCIASQRYEDLDQVKVHADALAGYMSDWRYSCVDGRHLLLIYKPFALPDYYLEALRSALALLGFNPFIVAISDRFFDWAHRGFDGLNFNPLGRIRRRAALNRVDWLYWGVRRRLLPHHSLRRIAYADYINVVRASLQRRCDEGHSFFPTCIPNWDNTPRSGASGLVLTGSTPALYQQHLGDCLKAVQTREQQQQLVMIKSWNEWAEGNYLEPDLEHGDAYLRATLSALSGQAES